MAVLDTALRPPGARRVDYLNPKGDPGFFGPDSVAWRVHANPVALAVGGVAAVILELAEPRVRSGVWDHSSFRTDPLGRMQRTAEATLITTYAPTAAAQSRVDMVGRMHGRVSGTTPAGEAYTALDPELATWVQVTAGWGFVTAYDRYVAPLGAAEKDRYFAEGAPLARAFGVPEPPRSLGEAQALFDRMRPRLEPSAILGEFLQLVSTTSPLGLAGRALQPLVVQAAVGLLPADLQRRLELPVRPLRRGLAERALPALARLLRRTPDSAVKDAYRRMGRPRPPS
jgi:uncharacterized protein (DUF2236 family)